MRVNPREFMDNETLEQHRRYKKYKIPDSIHEYHLLTCKCETNDYKFQDIKDGWVIFVCASCGHTKVTDEL
jgi:hypothetical protein